MRQARIPEPTRIVLLPRVIPPTRILLLAGAAMILLGGCDSTRPAPQAPAPEVRPAAQAQAQQIIAARCVVCHACYDSPCQLNLQSFPGLDRGASKAVVYDGARLLEAQPTRLGLDADSTAEWRRLGFHPVLSESGAPDPGQSVMLKLLAQKAANPLPPGPLDSQVFDFSVDRDDVCPTPAQADRYVAEHPQWGMPFGLPELDPQEYSALTRWLATGAVPLPVAPLPTDVQAQVEVWETFLNREDLKGRLIGRYLFEHLFLATIYLSEASTAERFRLVRSTTPPGAAIDIVASRRPYGDPGVDRVYYRLARDLDTLVRKRHMPYLLNNARLARWRELFFDAPFDVTDWPGYAPRVAANPFAAFRELPVEARYRFLLDQAQYTIDGFIKGPVCRGQIALDVINDHFWVFFMDPGFEATINDAEFLAAHLDEERLPAELGSNDLRPLAWRRYARQEHAYLKARAERLASGEPGRPRVEQIWAGNEWHGGQTLTVFRHFDSASVLQGLLGAPPKTAWIIDYPLLERIHYLLVAGYDVYGNVGHQLTTRLYMDFLRIGGELQFVRFLPPEVRRDTLAYWYRDAEDEIGRFIDDAATLLDAAGVAGLGNQPQQALFDLLRKHTGSAALTPPAGPHAEALQPLAAIRGAAASLMPELAYLTIIDGDRSEDWTVLRNSAHSNVASPFREDQRRLPAEDDLTVTPGFVGAHPNALFRLAAPQLAEFVAQLTAMRHEADYRALVDAFGIRRSDPDFWSHSDALHSRLHDLEPAEHGLLDYARLENR